MKRKDPRKIKKRGPVVRRARATELTARKQHGDLARKRIEKKLSIETVARRAGVSFVTVWRIELGLQTPSSETLKKLIQAIRKRTS